MMALDKDAMGAIVRLMGDDVPAGFGERALANYGAGSAWARTEPYDGPCLHDEQWSVQCGSCPHEGECGPFPSTFELLVQDYLTDTGRQAVDLDAGSRGGREEFGEIPF